MNINLFVFPFVIILGLLCAQIGTDTAKKGYIGIVSLVFLLESSLRGYSVGSDTLNYVYMFTNVGDYSWNEIWRLGLARYLRKESDFDVGFMAFQKLFRYFTSDFHVFTFLAQLVFFIPMGKMLYRYAPSIKSLIFAFVFFVALYQAHTFSGMRQLYAMGFSFLAVIFYDERRYKSAIFSMVIGFFIHMSILLMVVPLGISLLSFKRQRVVHLISFLLLPLVLLSGDVIVFVMGGLVGNEQYAGYGQEGMAGGATTFLLCLELLSFFCYLFLKDTVAENNRTARSLYCMLPCTTIFAPLIQVSGSMVRISEYYFLYMMVLFPLAMICYARSCKKGEQLLVILSIALAFFSIVTATGAGANYKFFWQDTTMY